MFNKRYNYWKGYFNAIKLHISIEEAREKIIDHYIKFNKNWFDNIANNNKPIRKPLDLVVLEYLIDNTTWL